MEEKRADCEDEAEVEAASSDDNIDNIFRASLIEMRVICKWIKLDEKVEARELSRKLERHVKPVCEELLIRAYEEKKLASEKLKEAVEAIRQAQKYKTDVNELSCFLEGVKRGLAL